MTLTLTLEMETRLHKVAKMLGREPDATLLELINQALCQYEYARYELGEEEAREVLMALQESEADYAEGRSILLEDYEQQIQERRRARTNNDSKDTL